MSTNMEVEENRLEMDLDTEYDVQGNEPSTPTDSETTIAAPASQTKSIILKSEEDKIIDIVTQFMSQPKSLIKSETASPESNPPTEIELISASLLPKDDGGNLLSDRIELQKREGGETEEENSGGERPHDRGKEVEGKEDGEDGERDGTNTAVLQEESHNGDNFQQSKLQQDKDDMELNCRSIFPFPADVNQNIFERLSSPDIYHFALSSKASYITAVPILFCRLKLPLSDYESGIERIFGVDIKSYVRTAVVDISNPVFWTTNYPGDRNIGRKLRTFENLKHLVVEKNSPYVSDAVLGSIFLYLVEQDSLEELTLDFTFQPGVVGITDFSRRFYECWRTVHQGAFHSRQRKLKTLNLRIANPDLVDDGLKDTPKFWVTILPTVQKLRLDLRDVPCPDSSATWTNYLHMSSSSGVVDMEVIFNDSIKRPYTEIGFHFPNVERLKVTFIAQTGNRPSAELSGLGRMKFLRYIDLPWAYDNLVPRDPIPNIVGTMYSKAKEKAKEVVQAKSQKESKDGKLKMRIQKQTKIALAIQRLTSIKEVTWRYKSEENGEDLSMTLSLHWAGTEPQLTEVEVGGNE
ncbi:hypothetical protein TWF730_005869 [Orbilia blumenaviensis]|uniref:F-box domain-containing protein n=1 Tax=Orbilia blumenaviensis TaxID=1796055 RepID=A0AAV9VLR7_9PEZI